MRDDAAATYKAAATMGNKQTIFTEEQLDNYQVSQARRGPYSPPPRGLAKAESLRFKPCRCLRRATSPWVDDFPAMSLSFPGREMRAFQLEDSVKCASLRFSPSLTFSPALSGWTQAIRPSKRGMTPIPERSWSRGRTRGPKCSYRLGCVVYLLGVFLWL